MAYTIGSKWESNKVRPVYFNINFISFLFQIFEHTMSEWLESKIVDKDILTLVNTLFIYFIMKTKMLISPKPKDYKNSNRLYFFSNVRTKTVRTWRQNSKKETLTKVYTLYIYDIMKKKLLNAKLNNLIYINILIFQSKLGDELIFGGRNSVWILCVP